MCIQKKGKWDEVMIMLGEDESSPPMSSLVSLPTGAAGTAALGVLRLDGPILAWHVPRDCTRVYKLVASAGYTG